MIIMDCSSKYIFLSPRILFVNLLSMKLFRFVSMDGVLLGVVIALKNPIVTIGASEKKEKVELIAFTSFIFRRRFIQYTLYFDRGFE